MPANIRSGHYQNEEDLKLENKFTIVSMKLPYCDANDSIESNIKKIKDMTTNLRNPVPGLLFYLFSKMMTSLFPFEITKGFAVHHSGLHTCALTNLPGPLTKRTISTKNASPDSESDHPSNDETTTGSVTQIAASTDQFIA